MVRLATQRHLPWFCVAVSAALGCGRSARSDQRRDEGDTGGSGGQAGSAIGGSAGQAGSATGGSTSGFGSSMNSGGTSGTAGSAGAAIAGSGGAPSIDLSGPWAMFHFGDPVAVSLVQDGSVLSGRGCCAGLNSGNIPISCCGEITDGSLVERRARFEFSFDFGLPYTYAADVVVSADGQRMLGSFSDSTLAMAWVPITGPARDGPGWLVNDDPILEEVIIAREGGYVLSLTGAPAGGSRYQPDVEYDLRISRYQVAGVYGDLGPFWAGEMTWQEGEQTLVTGPVPTTDPTYPIALRLRFEDVVLSAVEATMTSGDRYLFSATPR